MPQTIYTFIRDDNGNKRGIFLAERKGNTIKIGWSLCNVNLDVFNRDKGLEEARNRFNLPLSYVPTRIAEDLGKFIIRTTKYFKEAITIEIGI